MRISRKSPFSGETNVMDIAVTRADIINWEAGALIQDVMPNLNADEREFLMTGIPPDEWETNIKPED